MDQNIHRRHLNESQRAMIAAKLATMKLGSNQYRKEGDGIPSSSLSATTAVFQSRHALCRRDAFSQPSSIIFSIQTRGLIA
jgi:hypothetical protein